MVHFANLDGIVGEEVVDNEREVFADTEETEDLAIVVEELLLGGDAATSEGPFHEFLEVAVNGASDLDLGFGEGVGGVGLAIGLGLAKVLNIYCQ